MSVQRRLKREAFSLIPDLVLDNLGLFKSVMLVLQKESQRF
jgi:hypothetical protein